MPPGSAPTITEELPVGTSVPPERALMVPSASPGVRADQMRPKTADLLRSFSVDMYRTALNAGMSLSAWLERVDPESRYNDGLDSFARMFTVAEIRTYSDPYWGSWSDEMSTLFDDSRYNLLIPEWCRRVWRYVTASGSPQMAGISNIKKEGEGSRAFYTSADFVPGSVMNPYFDNRRPIVTPIVPVIPLDQVVAMTQGVDTDTYRAFYLTDVTAQERLVRVPETTSVPEVRLTGGDHLVRLHKYGRTLTISYEDLRRQRIDMFALHLAQLAAQTEADKVTAAMTVLTAGDGNSGTAATTYNLTTLDSGATPPNLTLKAWLAYRMKFAPPFALTTVLVQDPVALQLFLLSTGNANIPLVAIQQGENFGGFTAINPTLRDNVALGWTPDAPTNQIVGFDRRQALIYLTEIGADIQEVERWATRQIQALVMTEVDGFATFMGQATRILNLAS
jgi:hypothetical protein